MAVSARLGGLKPQLPRPLCFRRNHVYSSMLFRVARRRAVRTLRFYLGDDGYGEEIIDQEAATLPDKLQHTVNQSAQPAMKKLLGSSIRRWHNPNVDGFVYVGGNYAWNLNAEAIPGEDSGGISPILRGRSDAAPGNRPKELLGNLSRRILQFSKSFSSRQRSTRTTQTNILSKPSPLSSHKSNCWKVCMARVMRNYSWRRTQML
jgi:hypothetical protein